MWGHARREGAEDQQPTARPDSPATGSVPLTTRDHRPASKYVCGPPKSELPPPDVPPSGRHSRIEAPAGQAWREKTTPSGSPPMARRRAAERPDPAASCLEPGKESRHRRLVPAQSGETRAEALDPRGPHRERHGGRVGSVRPEYVQGTH